MHSTRYKEITVVSVPYESNTSGQVSRLYMFQLGEETKHRTAVDNCDASKSVMPDAASAVNRQGCCVDLVMKRAILRGA